MSPEIIFWNVLRTHIHKQRYMYKGKHISVAEAKGKPLHCIPAGGAVCIFCSGLLSIGDKVIKLPVAVIKDEFVLCILVDNALLKKIKEVLVTKASGGGNLFMKHS